MRLGSRCLLGLIVALSAVPAQGAERVLHEYLPDDTVGVVSFNVTQILEAPLTKRYLEREIENKVIKNEDLQKLITLLDFDPLTDLYRVSVAIPEKAAEGKFTVLLEGAFDPDKIHKVIVQFLKDVKVHKGTVPVYESRNEQGQTFFTAVIDTKYMVVSSDFAYMDEVIAKDAGRRKTKLDAKLSALVSKQDAKQAFWAAAIITDQAKELMAKNPQAKNFAGKIEAAVAGIVITEDVKLILRVRTTDAAAATDLKNLLGGLKTLAGFALNGNKDLPKDAAAMAQELLNSIKITDAQNTVALELTITGKMVDKAAIQSGKFGK